MKPFDANKLRAGLRRAVADAAKPPQTKMDVTRDPATNLINGVTMTPVQSDAAVAKAGEQAIEQVVDAIEDLQKRATVDAGQLGSMVADAVVEKAREVAEVVIGDMVAKAAEDLEAFRRREDEDYDEEDDLDDEDLEVAAEDIAEAIETVHRAMAPLADEVAQVSATVKAQAAQVRLVRSQVDALASLVEELGSVEAVGDFFRIARSVPISDDHPALTDPRVRILMFPDLGAGRASTETSVEHAEDDSSRAQSDQWADWWPRHRRQGDHVEKKQTMHDRKPTDLPGDEPAANGTGGQDFRNHRSPHPDAVLMNRRALRHKKLVDQKRKRRWRGRSGRA
jgi:hypothetical protein